MRGTTFRPETELEEDDIRRLTRDGVNIQLGNTRQTIHSFGASDCWTAKFIGDGAAVEKKNRIADLLFSMDTLAHGNPKGIGLSRWRLNIEAGRDRKSTRRNSRPKSASRS